MNSSGLLECVSSICSIPCALTSVYSGIYSILWHTPVCLVESYRGKSSFSVCSKHAPFMIFAHERYSWVPAGKVGRQILSSKFRQIQATKELTSAGVAGTKQAQKISTKNGALYEGFPNGLWPDSLWSLSRNTVAICEVWPLITHLFIHTRSFPQPTKNSLLNRALPLSLWEIN